MINDGASVDLSEQWLISCTDAGDCTGGWHYDAFAYLKENGLTDPCDDWGGVFEADFPYVALDTIPCECPYVHPYWLDDWAFVGSPSGIPSVEQLKQAILDQGPVAVAVYAQTPPSRPIPAACSTLARTSGSTTLWCWWAGTTAWAPPVPGTFAITGTRAGGSRATVGSSMSVPASVMRPLTLSTPVSQQTLTFSYPQGLPELASPEAPTVFRVQAAPGTGTPAPYTGRLYYRLDDGDWQMQTLAMPFMNEYEAALPPAPCFSTYDWYVAVGVFEGGYYFDPPDAPMSAYEVMVATGFEATLQRRPGDRYGVGRRSAR